MNLMISMAAFALAASISPGPVNVVALSCGAQFGLAASLRHVTGATVGFVLLLMFTGFGLHEVLLRYPMLTDIIRWAGMAFLIYLAWKLAMDDGQLQVDKPTRRPSLLRGAAMQWLNPKAWIACLSGVSAFNLVSLDQLTLFTLLYFAVCYPSIACWALVGDKISRFLSTEQNLKRFNQMMGGGLVVVGGYLGMMNLI